MKKIVKATIAAAAGAVLLLGGAGTFATWNASATDKGSTIVAGNLVVKDSGAAGVWTANGSTAPISLAGYAIAPGDTLTYTKKMSITAEGDRVVANLALSPTSITAANPANANDQALNNASMFGAVNLSDLTVTLTQKTV